MEPVEASNYHRLTKIIDRTGGDETAIPIKIVLDNFQYAQPCTAMHGAQRGNQFGHSGARFVGGIQCIQVHTDTPSGRMSGDINCLKIVTPALAADYRKLPEMAVLKRCFAGKAGWKSIATVVALFLMAKIRACQATRGRSRWGRVTRVIHVASILKLPVSIYVALSGAIVAGR